MTFNNSTNKNRNRGSRTSTLVSLRDLLFGGVSSISPSLDGAAQAAQGVIRDF